MPRPTGRRQGKCRPSSRKVSSKENNIGVEIQEANSKKKDVERTSP